MTPKDASGAGLLAVAVCSSWLGCSSSSASSESAFADQYCNLVEPCCAGAGLSMNVAACHSFFSYAASQSSGYNASAGAQCLDAIRSAKGNPQFCMIAGAFPQACHVVFTGTPGSRQPGQPCTADAQCAHAAGGVAACVDRFNGHSGAASSSDTQTCEQALVGSVGDSPCVGTLSGGTTVSASFEVLPPGVPVYLCDDGAGTLCDSTLTCASPVGVGGSCGFSSDCVSNAYCDAHEKCVDRLPDGASCNGLDFDCETTSYCDSNSQTCTALLGTGAACNTDMQCQFDNCVNNACVGGSLLLVAVCGH